jgi:DNA-binding NtrC family response regulator
MNRSILIVEDEPLLSRNVARYLERQQYEVAQAPTLARGIADYEELRPDVVLVDHSLPDGTGIDLIRHIRQRDLDSKIVMITAHGSVALAVTAMKSGADDYLTKPVSLEELGLLVNRLLSRRHAEESLAYYRRREEQRSGLDRIAGASPRIVELKRQITQVLAMEARQVSGPPPPVLVTGETGTGKELVARALHFEGPRHAEPFVEINCATLSPQLIESELFGHERGAFTDAKERRSGLILAADRGTLFLDEIAEMPLASQAKVLKVIEDRRVRPVGSTRDRSVDVRFVAATNAGLEERVRTGEFREDLMYRLRAITLSIPPLRARDDDVVLLAEHFMAEHRLRYGRPELRLDTSAIEAIRRHSWPGNVRELRNVLEQAALLTIGERIRADDLSLREPPALQGQSDDVPGTAGATLDSQEHDLIVQALRRVGGNVTLAAQALGITRDTLRYRMDKHQLRRSAFT